MSAKGRGPYHGVHTEAPAVQVPSEEPHAHPDWLGPPSSQDLTLERDIAHVLERIQAERSELRRHAMWRLYAAKVRMRSDAELRRQAIVSALREAP